MVRVLVVLIGFLVVCAPSQSEGQEAFDETWNLEMSHGPIIAPANVIGMGGAYIGLAEGSGAQAFNPAAVAMRYPYNGNEWFDWDWAIDWLIAGLNDGIDVANDGRAGTSGDVQRTSIALNLLFGRFGVGINVRLQKLESTCAEGSSCGYTRATYESNLGGLTMGYNFFGGELVVASELTLPDVTISLHDRLPDSNTEELMGQISMNDGSALTLGAVWRPTERPFRLGMTARKAIPVKLNHELTTNPDAVESRGLVIPNEIAVPWQIGVGGVYSFGPRELNPKTSFGDDGLSARDEGRTPMWRDFLLVALDLVVLGDSKRAGGVGAWMAGEVEQTGEKPTLSWRLGMESEFWPGVMRGRMGTYYEPSRYATAEGRMHWTIGLDVALFELVWDWRLTAGIDLSRDYSNTLLSLGFWH